MSCLFHKLRDWWLYKKKPCRKNKYTMVHPCHALRQCLQYIMDHPTTSMHVQFSDRTRKTQSKLEIYFSSWRTGELKVMVSYNLDYNLYSRFAFFVQRHYFEIKYVKKTHECIMGLFESIILDDTPLRLHRILVGYMGIYSENPLISSQTATCVTMYNVTDKEECALDMSVRREAARKITRAASLWLARKRTRQALRDVLMEVLFAPPCSFHPSFPGGVGYNAANIRFHVIKTK